VPTEHFDFVQRAAKKHGQTMSEYVGETMTEHAAKVLGEAVPVVRREVVAALGKKLGMSRAELRRQAEEEFIARHASKVLAEVSGFERGAVVKRRRRTAGSK